MAHVGSEKSSREKAESCYIQAAKPRGRTPVSRRLFPQASREESQQQREANECENAWECGSSHGSVGDFDAIPEEFRPSRRGKDLMRVRASPTKEESKDKVNAEETHQNKRFPNKPHVPQRNGGARNSNPSATQNEVGNYKKEVMKTEESERPQSHTDMISDETGKLKKPSGMFFYNHSSQNESNPKPANGGQRNRVEIENCHESPEKSNLKNVQDEKHFRSGFYNSESIQSKTTKGLDMHSSFEKHNEEANFIHKMPSRFNDKNTSNQNGDKEETNLSGFKRNMQPKFQNRNVDSPNWDKGEANIPKYDKNIPSKFHDRNANNQKSVSFEDESSQKVMREVTVEKRIQWKNDLCNFKKPENKPNYFYEYTKTTKESVKYVPSHNEDEDNEATKKSYQNFEKGREICNNFRRKDFGRYKQRSGNQNYKKFDSTCKTERNEAKHFSKERTQKNSDKFEERHNIFQCGNGADPIIIKHEIKVIHVNQRGNKNRVYHHSSQTFQPYSGRNGKIINDEPRERKGKIFNTYPRGRNGKIINNAPKERDSKMTNNETRGRNGRMTDDNTKERSGNMCTDPRAENGKINNTDSREFCGVKIEENTMNKTTEVYQRTRRQIVRIPLKKPGSFSKTENTRNNVSRTINSGNGEVLTKYGRDISDGIAGSYVAISTFLDNYEQWKDIRRVTMLLFQEVEKNLSQSCAGNSRIGEVAALVGAGCKVAQLVPHPGVSIAAKVIAILSDIVAKVFSSSNSATAKSIGMDDFQLRLCLKRDVDATSDIYDYGMQCDINFHETCQLIEEFHREIQGGRFKEFEETFETGFLKEISLLNPQHPAVFYKKLGRFYKLLNEKHESEEGKTFCGAFEDWPDALTTVSRLHRRFQTKNWDSSSVMKAWEEVYNLLQNDKSSVEDVRKKIQDCIFVLIGEQTIMERYVMDLQRQC